MNERTRNSALLFILDDIQTTNEFFLQRIKQFQREKMLQMYRKRQQEGCYNILYWNHLVDDDTKFRQYFRLSPYLFNYVLSHIENDITKPFTNFVAKPISPREKLCMALRFIATGESYRSLSFHYRVSFSYTSVIIREVLKSIKERLLDICIPPPTEEVFMNNANHNFHRWNFPHCIGALDGKHIRIKCPPNSASLHYNYKHFFSVVLLAIVDGKMRFNAIDVGAYGREGDAGVFSRSNFGKAISSGQFNIPAPTNIAGTNVVAPYVFLGDSAFGLTENLMVPFSQRQAATDPNKAVFNYRYIFSCNKRITF